MNTISLTVFHDAVKLEITDHGRREMAGWYADEIDAIGAATEQLLFNSAEDASRRSLPPIAISIERKDEWIKRPVQEFNRALRVKHAPEGRRVVMKPGAFGKPWIKPVENWPINREIASLLPTA